MSGKVVGWAMEQITGSPAAKLVLVKLADNASEDGLCWPSVDLIVEHTELGQSTVYKHLVALESMGLITCVTRMPARGWANESVPLKAYQLNIPTPSQAIPPRRKPQTVILPDGIAIPADGKTAPPGGKVIPPGGIPYKEEPSLEPSVEPSLSSERESSNAVSKKVDPVWSEIWTAFTSWPGAPDDWPEGLAYREWQAIGGERPSDAELILTIRAHAKWLTEENRRRSSSAGNRFPASPHRWIASRRFEGYLKKARAGVLAKLESETLKPMLLDAPIISRILRAGVSRAQIDSYFAGATFEMGPPSAFRQPNSFAASWIQNHFAGRLRGEFGDDLIIVQTSKEARVA